MNIDIEIVNKINSLENDYSDGAVNYLEAISPSIGAPKIYHSCFCKESSRMQFSKEFFMWWNTVKNLD